MYDIISIGSISIDLFFKSDSFTFQDKRFQLAVGGKYFAPYFHTSLGGGGANVAIGGSKHGLKVAVAGVIGDNPFRKIILDHLDLFKISHKLCKTIHGYYNTSCILLTEKGERTIIHHSTPHQKFFDNFHPKSFGDSKFVYLGNLPEISLTQKKEFVKDVKKEPITFVLNLGVQDCRKSRGELEGLLKYMDILILNGHEFAELVKAPFKDIHFHEDVVSWYIPFIQKKMVVVTLGEKGSFAYEDKKIFHQKAITVEKMLDTTGAGDAFTAGFIGSYLKIKNISTALEEGSRYASKILSRVGAN